MNNRIPILIKIYFYLICLHIIEEETTKMIIQTGLENTIDLQEIDQIGQEAEIRRNTRMRRRRRNTDVTLLQEAQVAHPDIESTKRIKQINTEDLDQEALSIYHQLNTLRRKEKSQIQYYKII
jgi:hypothetical protein